MPRASSLDPDAPFGLPFRPTPFTATFTIGVAARRCPSPCPCSRARRSICSVARSAQELLVVPALAVTASPETVDRAVARDAGQRPRNAQGHARDRDQPRQGRREGRGDARAAAGVARHAGGAAGLLHARGRSLTVRFLIDVPPSPMLASAAAKPGGSAFAIKAMVKDGASPTRRATRLVEYPHTRRRHVLIAPQGWRRPSTSPSAEPHVGYVMGVGDQVPPRSSSWASRDPDAPTSWPGATCRSTTS